MTHVMSRLPPGVLRRITPLPGEHIRFESLRRFSRRFLLLLAVWVWAAWMWERGMQHDLPPWCATLATALDAGALAALLLGAVIRFLPPTRSFRRYAGGLEGVLAVVSALEWSLGGDHRLPLLAGQLVHLASSTGGRVLRERLIAKVEAGAARLAPLSFAIVIAVGTIALALPIAARDGSPTSFVDAAFTATSAACVTGLTVRDTPTHFSSFGHWIILALMQIGGLGTMTLSLSLIAILRPPSGRQREALMQVMGGTERVDVFRMVRFIAVATLVFEVIGWGLLVVVPGPASPSGSGRVFIGLFHAVSAFCNAGFSLWSDSLERAPTPAILTISVLIIAGGLGFPILNDLSGTLFSRGASRGTTTAGVDPNGLERLMRRRLGGWKGLSLHTRLGLVTTAFLIVGGAILVFFGEYDNTMRELPFGDKIAHAYFQSVTTRTAGFNSLPFGRFAPALLFAACALMIIGACPGGTGGGIKTTTAASLVLSLRSLVSSRGRLEAFGRDLPDSLFQKAVAITLAYLGTLFFGVFLLLVIEPRPAIHLLFEATSALGTVGLSTGITPLLCVEAKLVLIALMFVGRVGPLALALSVGQRRPSGRYRYPSGDVIVG